MNFEELVIKLKNLKNNDNKYSFLASYILDNVAWVIKHSIYDLADAAFSSPSTIVRMCKENSLSGFKELIAVLKSKNGSCCNHESFDLASQLIEQINVEISETRSLLDMSVIDRFVSFVNEKKEIILFGYGESALMLEVFQSRLLRIGIKTLLFNNQENSIILANIIDNNSIVFVLSLSGSSQTVIGLSKVAKEKGAVIFALTKYIQNPIKKLCDYHINLSYNPDENYLISKTVRYSIIFVLDLIYEKIIASQPDTYLSVLEATLIEKK